MFDLSFGHIVVCFLVALIVLGPERLPGAARAVGRWTGKARAYMRNFTAELERETQVGELRKQLDEARRVLQEQHDQMHGTARDITAEAHALANSARAMPGPVSADPAAAPQTAPAVLPSSPPVTHE